MGASKTHRSVVRPEWLFRLAQHAQILAGEIAIDRMLSAPALREKINQGISPPRSRCETLLLRGITAEAEEAVVNANRPRPLAPIAARAAEVLRNRYTEDWPGERLARELGTNRCDLYREFRAFHGMTPHQFQALWRVRAIEAAIANGEKVEAASLLAGYRSKSSFYYTAARVRRLQN